MRIQFDGINGDYPLIIDTNELEIMSIIKGALVMRLTIDDVKSLEWAFKAILGQTQT